MVERTLKFKSYFFFCFFFFFFVYIWSLIHAAMTRIQYSSYEFPRTATDKLSHFTEMRPACCLDCKYVQYL